MRKSKFLNALLLTMSVGNVWGSDWQELPCISEVIDNVKLEANSSSLRISSGREVLTTMICCHEQDQLVKQLESMSFREGGVFVISSVGSNLILDYEPTHRGLGARIGGSFAPRTISSCLRFGGISYVITVVSDLVDRLSFQHEKTDLTTEGKTQTTEYRRINLAPRQYKSRSNN